MNRRFDHLMSEILGLDVAAVADELALASVEGWDSLRHISLVAGLESTFAIELTFDEIVAARTVGDFRLLVEARGAAGK